LDDFGDVGGSQPLKFGGEPTAPTISTRSVPSPCSIPFPFASLACSQHPRPPLFIPLTTGPPSKLLAAVDIRSKTRQVHLETEPACERDLTIAVWDSNPSPSPRENTNNSGLANVNDARLQPLCSAGTPVVGNSTYKQLCHRGFGRRCGSDGQRRPCAARRRRYFLSTILGI